MNNDIKTKVREIESPELLKYKLEVLKRDNKKNILIAILVTGIFAFASGCILSTFTNSQVNALTSANAKLKVENSNLEVENQSLKALNQKDQ